MRTARVKSLEAIAEAVAELSRLPLSPEEKERRRNWAIGMLRLAGSVGWLDDGEYSMWYSKVLDA